MKALHIDPGTCSVWPWPAYAICKRTGRRMCQDHPLRATLGILKSTWPCTCDLRYFSDLGTRRLFVRLLTKGRRERPSDILLYVSCLWRCWTVIVEILIQFFFFVCVENLIQNIFYVEWFITNICIKLLKKIGGRPDEGRACFDVRFQFRCSYTRSPERIQ